MIKTNCPKVAKNLFILLIVSLVFVISFSKLSSYVYALTSENINFQGKIVRNDTGHEGLNVIPGTPACVVDGAGNDTCDFQVAYYTASTGGTLLLTETFSNVEIGQYDGVFELSLGSGSMTTTAQCRDGTCNTPMEVLSEYTDVYVELKFAPDGTNLTETFTRMPLEASPYSIFSKYAEGAHDAFKLSTSLSSQTQSSPTTGMIYYNTTSSKVQLYNGTAWENISGESLWTDAGTFTYLTSTTDDLVLGASTGGADGIFYFDMNASDGSYFDVNDTSSNRLFTILSGGNVGIGTATPGAKLEVAGASSTITNASGDLTISTGGLNGNILLSPHGTGSVRVNSPFGIRETGTTPTFYTYFVGGDQTADVTYTLPTADGTVSGQVLTTNASGVLSWTTVATGAPRWNEILAPNGNLSLAHAGYTTSFTFDSITDATGFGMSSSSLTTGYVLGLSTTSTALTTGGLLNISATGAPAAAWSGALAKIEYDNADADVDGSALQLGLLGTTALGSGTVLNITTSQTGTGALALRVNDDGTYTDTTPFVIDSGGQVGIGTPTPGYNLHVVGTFLTGSGNRYVTIGSSGVVTSRYDDNGIKTTLVLENRSSAYGDEGVQALFNLSAGSGVAAGAGSINVAKEQAWTSTPSTQDSYLSISTRLDGTLAEKLRLTSAGNFGIGVTSPTAYLHLKAGTTAANTAPLKFTTGVNLTTAESGAMEWDGSRLYITDTTPTRNTIAYTSDIPTSDNYQYWRIQGDTGGPTNVTSNYLVDFEGSGGISTAFTANKLTISTTGVLEDLNTLGAATAADQFIVSTAAGVFAYESGSTVRTSLGATTVGSNLFTLTNPSAITFLRVNADNTVSALNASDFRTAIGAGTGSGTVTSVTAGTGLTADTNPITTTGTISFDYTKTLSSSALGSNVTMFGSTGVLFEGSTSDGNMTLLTATNPTADNTITLPNSTGTVALTSQIPTVYWSRNVSGYVYPTTANDDILPNTTGDIGATGSRWNNIYGVDADLTSSATTTNVLNIVANSLTSGNGLKVSSTATTGLTGNLVDVSGSLSTGSGSLLGITANSINGTGSGLKVTSSTTGALTNGLVYVNGSAAHTGNLVNVVTATATGVGLNSTGNALTTGTLVTLSSSSTALTTGGLLSISATGAPAASWSGDLGKIEYNNADADVDGSALKLGLLGTTALGSGTVLNITTSQTGTGALALRVNDDGTYTDTTPFVIDSAGNVGIGAINPEGKLDIMGNTSITGNLYTTGSMDSQYGGIGSGHNLLTNSVSNISCSWDTTKTSSQPGPDGTNTAAKFEVTSDSLPYSQCAQSYTTTADGRTFTFSIWLKAGNITDVSIGVSNQGGVGGYKNITLTNEWKRYSYTYTIASGTAAAVRVFPNLDATSGDGNIGDYIYAWGPQLEESSTAGIYIETSSTSILTNVSGIYTNQSAYIMDSLGVGTISPSSKVHIIGSGNTSSTYTLKAVNSDSNKGLIIRDDGAIYSADAGTVSSQSFVWGSASTAGSTGQHIVLGNNSSSNASGGGIVNAVIGNSNTTSGSANYLFGSGLSSASSFKVMLGSGVNGGYFSSSQTARIVITSGTPSITFLTQESQKMVIDAAGNVGIGVASPTAYLHLKAGTAAANTAPLKFTTGVNLTTAESGAMEWDGSRLYITNTTPTRNTIAYLTDIVADTDNYVDSVSFNTSDGILTLGRTGILADLTADLDGRYALSSAGSLFTDSGAITWLTSTTDDFSIGGNNTLVAPFSVDVSANTVRIGTGATANAVLNMYASDGDTGSITYTTNDRWEFSGGGVYVDANAISVNTTNSAIGFGQSAVVGFLTAGDYTEVNTTHGASWNGSQWIDSLGAYSAERLALGANGLVFYTGSDQAGGNPVTWTEKFRLTKTGEVGIGTTSPDYALQVNGVIAPETDTQDLGTSALSWDLYANAIYDSDGDIGTNGQVLSSTASGTNWIGATVDTDDQTLAEVLVQGNTAGSLGIDMNNNLITNIGNANTDFTTGGGLTLATTLGLRGSTSGLFTSIAANVSTATWTLTLPANDGDNLQVLTTDGSGNTSWTTVATGSSALSAITAATTTNTINSGDNGAQIWNWALTTADRVAFTFGESSASTATGTPVILSAATVANSTAIPLFVKNYGNATSFRVDDVSGDTTPFIIDASGNVGIGTSTPGFPLDVNGDARIGGGELYLTGISSSSSTTEGTLYYDTDDDQLKVYANGKWQVDRSTATYIVGTSNSTTPSKNYEKADYVCGDTDCDTTIETAIAALPSTGGVIVLLDGLYIIDNSVNINGSNVSLVGSGRATVLKRAYDSASGEGVVTVGSGGPYAYSSGVRLENFSIDGNNGTYTSTNNYGIHFLAYSTSDHLTDSIARNIYCHNNAGHGFAINNANENSIEDSISKNNNIGVYLYNSSYNNISDNEITNNTVYGVQTLSASNNKFSENIISENGTGVYTNSGNTYSNNHLISNTSWAFELFGASYNLISNNRFVDNGGGVYTHDGGSYNNIIGNIIYDSAGTDYGINIGSGGTNNYISGNEISGAGIATEISASGTNTVQHRDMFEVETATTTGIGAYIEANSLTSGKALQVISSATTGLTGNIADFSGSLTTGSGSIVGITANAINGTGNGLKVTTSTTGALTNGLVYVNGSAAHTGNLVNVTTATATGVGLNVTANSLTSGNGLKVSSTATTGLTGNLVDVSGSLTTGAGSLLAVTANAINGTGSGLKVTTSTTGGLTNGLVYVNGSAAHTGNLVNVTTATATGVGLNVAGNSITTGTVSNLSSTSTAGGASGSSYVLNISRSGANTNLAHTAYGIYSNVTNTNVTSGTNIAGYFSASGATTANYGILVGGTATNDKIGVSIANLGATSYIGTITNADLTAARTWTLPDVGGTIPLGTGTANYVAFWSGTNTLGSEQYLATSRGGLGANVTAAGAGELLYSTAATTYDSLVAGTSGQILKSGGAGAPTWNTAGALTKTDDTNVTLTLGGSATTALVNAASITVGWSGTLAATRGGTGLGTYTTGDILYASAANTLSARAIGTTGQVLTVVSGVPQWATPASGSLWTDGGVITYLTATGDDLAVGGSTSGSPFFVDVSANMVRIGTGATASAVLNMYASDGDTGSITYTTSDAWEFNGGNVGIGISSPTAILHLDAGSATAGTAPLKFTAGTNLTTEESGAMEWDGSRLYITDTTLSRNTIAYTSDLSGLITGVKWNEIQTPEDNLSIAHGAYTTNFSFDSVTTLTAFAMSSSSLTSGKILGVSSSATGMTGSLVKISLTDTTGNAANTGKLLEIANEGVANTGTSVLINHYATGTGNLAFRVNDEDTDTTPFVITGTGNVGIGDSGPTNKLVVNNNISTKSTIELQYNGTPVVDIFSNVSSNIFMGLDSGQAITTGTGNVAYGFNSLYANTTGVNNVAIGHQALSTNVARQGSTALGYQAMMYADSTVTAGLSYNTAVGYQALTGSGSAASNTGTANTAIGHQVLTGNTTGSYNVGVGANVLNANTTGTQNIAIGYNALFSNVAKSGSVAIGYEAMRYANSSATGSAVNNIALGYQALRGSATPANNIGTNNIAIGSQAMYSVTSGSKNVALGETALYSSQTAADNVALGYGALYNATGDGNIAIGYQAGDLASFTGSNNIIIGYNIDMPATTSSNMLNIGNLIYGTGLDGSGQTLSTGNVGIGTNAPSTLLQLGTPGSRGGVLSLAGATSGLVTIDTLATAGTWTLTLPGNDGDANQALITDGSGNTSWTGIPLGTGSGSATAGQVTFWNGTSSITGNNNFWWDNSNVRLGIGTSSPTATLDIGGASSRIANSSGDITIDPAGNLIIASGSYVGIGTASPAAILDVAGVTSEIANSLGDMTINPAGNLIISTGSNVLIGGSSSSEVLGVSGRIEIGQMAAPTVTTDKLYNVSGNLYWNGRQINTGVVLFSASNDAVTNGSYLSVAHNQNTNDILAEAWIYDTASSTYKPAINYSTTLIHDDQNEFDDAASSGSIRTVTKYDAIELEPGVNIGTGADGDVYLSAGSQNLDTTNYISGRSCTDGGDAVNYSVSSFNSGGTQATLTTSPSTGCLKQGDEVLIINLQGTSSAYGNVGNYETLIVDSISTNTVTFKTAKTKYYGDGASDDTNIGTTSGTQRVMLQRVPNYEDFFFTGGNVYCSDWNGQKGGVIFFRATGQVNVPSGSSITAEGRGYLGGTGQANFSFVVPSGESIYKETSSSSYEGYGSNAVSGAPNTGYDGTFSGGGGGGKYTTSAGGAGGAGNNTTPTGGGGGGGSVTRYDSTTNGGNGGGGGGGGYGTPGTAGLAILSGSYGTDGSSGSSGAGGPATRSSGNNAGGGGGGGASNYGDAYLDKLFFGSGGGAGGAGHTYSGTSYAGGNGGDGGGIIVIAANAISLSGFGINADGNDGTQTSSQGGGGGGGAGGSIKIEGISLNIGTSIVTSSGGAGGNYSTNDGGSGGSGRIAIYVGSSITGSTSPTYSAATAAYNNYGLYHSAAIPTPNAATYDLLRWDEDLDTYGEVSFQTRSGNSTNPNDGTWSSWSPNTTNTVINSADTHTDFSGTDGTVADGTETRDIDYFEDEDESTAGNTTKFTNSVAGSGYAEATISAKDLSSYDFITFWVHSTAAGNTVKVGIGESAATEQEETITIDATNTWQKVYWDITDITSTSRDGITKLRVTNLSGGTQTIHFDNFKGENYLSNASGSTVPSLPNNYVQYRIIFTTTNTSYRPAVESISFTYRNGVKIEQVDANTVRLYNYTGSTQKMRLDVGVTGADLAEWYTADQYDTTFAGEIVSSTGRFDSFGVPIVSKTTVYNDSKVMGIISTKANTEMGTGGENRKLIALAGRVPVKIDPLSPSINVGDYITSSGVNGMGIKAIKQGVVVGKALESWDSSSGKQSIMVLVNLSYYNPTSVSEPKYKISEPGWYKIAELKGLNGAGKIKISNTSLGSMQNLILSINYIDEKLDIKTLSNFVTGGFDIKKFRISEINGEKYLDIYIPSVNDNILRIEVDGESDWESLDVYRAIDSLSTESEGEVYGIVFGSDSEDSEGENGITFNQSLLATSGDANIGGSFNRWNDIYAKGTIRIGSGIGGEGAIRFNLEKGALEFSNDGKTWLQLGDLSSQSVLSPEYPGAILYADGSDNFGVMTSDAEESTGSFKNYYEWIASKDTPQDYDILVRITLPDDFVSWKEDSIYLDFMTENSGSIENNKVDMYLMGKNGIDAQSTDGISAMPGEWQRMSIKGLDINDCNNAGDVCTLRISVSSSLDYFVRVGDITLNYNRGL